MMPHEMIFMMISSSMIPTIPTGTILYRSFLPLHLEPRNTGGKALESLPSAQKPKYRTQQPAELALQTPYHKHITSMSSFGHAGHLSDISRTSLGQVASRPSTTPLHIPSVSSDGVMLQHVLSLSLHTTAFLVLPPVENHSNLH